MCTSEEDHPLMGGDPNSAIIPGTVFTQVINRRSKRSSKNVNYAESIPASSTPSTSAAPAKKNPPSKKKLPPVVVKSMPFAALKPPLQRHNIDAECLISGIGSKVFACFRDDRVISFLNEAKVDYFTHDLKEGDPKTVIRGLPRISFLPLHMGAQPGFNDGKRNLRG